VASLRGVELQQEGGWSAPPEGWSWPVGAELRADRGGGRIVLASGAVVSLERGARVRLREPDPPRLRLEAGALYCAVPPAERAPQGTRFAVETAELEALVTGTEFGVERKGTTTSVAVAGGVVRCRNEAGELELRAGQTTRSRRGRAPGKARFGDADALFRWRRRLDPPELPVFRYDFERGATPPEWVQGEVAQGAPRRGRNRFALRATQLTPGKPAEGSAVNLAIPVPQQVRQRPRLVRFRYYTEQAGELGVQLKDETWGDNCKHPFFRAVTGAWERVELPCERFLAWPQGKADPQRPIRPGDQLRYLQIRFIGGLAPSYVDDVELVEQER